MVSLLNSEGPNLRLNCSEVMTQFPNYLYDPYAYPSNLNSMDYHWNLFYPQNHYAIQNKRKKKMKEQVANERVIKEILPSFEHKKEYIIDWLKSLSLEKKLEIFSIQNNWLVSTFIKMYKKWSECHNIVFAMLQDGKRTGGGQDLFELNNLENSFYCRRKPIVGEISPFSEQLVEDAEKEIIENFRIYDGNELYDTIVPKESFVNDVEKLVALFQMISDNLAFTKPCKPTYEHGTKSITWDSPFWFSPHSFQSFPAWVVSSLEKAVWTSYFDEKIGGIKNNNYVFNEGREFRLNLKYKQDLTDFWKNLEKSKKKKLLSSVTEIHKSLINEKNKSEKEIKDVDQKLKNLFLGFSHLNTDQISTAIEISNYFQSLFDSENDDEVLNNILFTHFEELGNLTNLICRKLTLKLKNMLADRIATDLILNEEKEKTITNKKNLKKKNATKKPNKSNLFSKIVLQPEEINKQESLHELDDCSSNLLEETNRTSTEQSHGNIDEHSTDIKLNCEISKKTANKSIISHCDNETPSNRETIHTQGSQSQIKTPEEKRKNRKLSFGNDLSHRPDELSTDHSIEEQKKELETESKNEKEILMRNNTPKRMKSYTCHAQNAKATKIENFQESMQANIIFQKEGENNSKKQRTRLSSLSGCKDDQRNLKNEKSKNNLSHNLIKKSAQDDAHLTNNLLKNNYHKITLERSDKEIKNEYSIARNDVDTTDSESGLLLKEGAGPSEKENSNINIQATKENYEGSENSNHGSSQDFIEIKPKKKKSVKPFARGKNEHKESLTKRKDRNFIDKSDNSNEKIEKTEKSKLLNQPKILSKIIEPKNIEETKKVISHPSINLQLKETALKACQPEEKSETHLSPLPKLVNKANNCVSENGTTGKNPTIKKPLRTTHKLSLASPSIDFEAITTSKVKNLVKEYFDNKFTKDIYNHVEQMTNQSNHLTNARILVYKRLDHCIAWTFPMYNMKTKIFGSCATGLALVTSDVDIAVSGIETYDRPTLCECLSTISEVLKSFKWVISNKPILTAHVPVLKLEINPCLAFDEIFDEANDDPRIRDILFNQAAEFNLAGEENMTVKVDLTLEGLGMLGYTVLMGYKSTEFAEKMLAKHKSLYIITMVLKEFLFNRQLLNTYQGGVSSYCLIIMIVAVLEKYGDEGFMKSLRRIMKFYGEEFQPEKMGISLSEADPFFPLNHSYETAPLWILDHNNLVERRNVGQGAYSIKIILYEFARVSTIIDFLHEKLEELVLQHKSKVQRVEDIELVDDIELKQFIESNLLNHLIMC